MSKRKTRGTVSCPKCNDCKITVSNSRINANGDMRRRRTCESCGHKWSTVELIVGSNAKQFAQTRRIMEKFNSLSKDQRLTVYQMIHAFKSTP